MNGWMRKSAVIPPDKPPQSAPNTRHAGTASQATSPNGW